jgi:uncharacterized membrane protein
MLKTDFQVTKSKSRFTHWFNKNYMWVIILLIFVFLLGAFTAPIFMKLGLDYPAKIFYSLYSPFCHQLAFRSWFLFGEQPFYPRELAGISGYLTYEQITNDQTLNLDLAREYIGNNEIGYKAALCQRDVAIYSSLLIIAFYFQLKKRKIKPLPWYIWVIIGLIPIGIDGVTQFGGLGIPFLSWLPVRESTPLLRTVTGTLFGLTTGLFLFPLIEETIQFSPKSPNNT